MKGFGKFFSEKLGLIQEKVSDSVGKLKEELATDLVNITAKVNEKVTAYQTKAPSEKKEQAQANFDLNIVKLMRGIALWFLAVVQEPSLGMYYVQNHLKDSLDRTLNSRKEVEDFQKKLEALNMDVAKTKKEVEGIAQLNTVWANSMSILLDELDKTYKNK